MAVCCRGQPRDESRVVAAKNDGVDISWSTRNSCKSTIMFKYVFLRNKAKILRKTRFLTCWVKAVVSEQDLGGGVGGGGGGGEEDTPHRNKGYISGISRDLEFPSH